jgi:hypothetical protein
MERSIFMAFGISIARKLSRKLKGDLKEAKKNEEVMGQN